MRGEGDRGEVKGGNLCGMGMEILQARNEGEK